MSMSKSYDPRTVVVGEPGRGETLEDFYKIHNLDEKRRKYLDEIRSKLNNLSTTGTTYNLIFA